MTIHRNRWVLSDSMRVMCICSCMCAGAETGLSQQVPAFQPTIQLSAPAAEDQDDICLWLHPTDASASTVIASDKSANFLFVYDLDGHLLQSIPVAKPGNIDIRQNVILDGIASDVVVVNQRTGGFRLVVFKVDSASRTLERIDNNCLTAANYGGCLYHSRKSSKLYFVCTSETGMVSQYELREDGQGKLTASLVRELKIGKCEGAVADDESGSLYIGEEREGVWKFAAEPDVSSKGTLIAKVGDNGLKGDVEGLTICNYRNGVKYLLVSDQGSSRFAAYQCESPNAFVGEFKIESTGDSDGIEVCSSHLSKAFPDGVFVCHNGLNPRGLCLTPWGQIEASLFSNDSPNTPGTLPNTSPVTDSK
ncbi:MAG: phytase [Planctomycetaceae bacterium]